MNIAINEGYVRYVFRKREYEGKIVVGKDNKFEGLSAACALKEEQNGQRLKLTLRPEGAVVLRELHISCAFNFLETDTVYCNGYQSWTDSREFAANEKILPLRGIMRLIKMHRYGDIHFHPYSGKPGEFHSHTYTYIRRGSTIALMGSLSESEGYTIFQYQTHNGALKIIKDCAGLEVDRNLPVLDVFIATGEEQHVFTGYFSASGLKARANVTTGWTSWYNYYTKISEDIILGNVRALSEHRIPLDIIQIDDGFQTAVGDWRSIKPEFPQGMKKIADEIHKAGYAAGLWLAPFICEKKSKLFSQHKHWLVKDDDGTPIVAGWNPGWSGDFYALDIYNDQARNYIEDVFSTVLREWNFDMVKLDFLYAAAIVPRKGKSRGKIMHDAMELLRRCVRGKRILGCGVPLGPAFGLVEYCRIGGDVALKWEDRLLKFMRYRERVDTKHSLTSTIGRRHLNGHAFFNDPDVFILRDENNSLSPEEKDTLYVLNNIFGGLVFTSDNVANYPKETLRYYLAHFPLRAKTIAQVRNAGGLHEIRFSIGALSYCAWANMGDESSQFTLPEGAFCRHDARTGEVDFLPGKSTIVLRPHETQCFLHIAENAPALAGSSGHIFPASEVETFKFMGKNFTVKLHPKAQRPNAVFVRVAKAGTYHLNGAPAESKEVLPGVHLIKAIVE